MDAQDATYGGKIVTAIGGKRAIGGVVALGALIGALAAASSGRSQTAPVSCDQPTTSFCNATPAIGIPANWTGHRFVLAQNYPARSPRDAQPWLAIDPKTDPGRYVRSILEHFYEGNLRSDITTSFDPRLNKVRGWYNAPWQDVGGNGREPIHGLTRERVSSPFELDAKQPSYWNNFAVGFYNAPGGVTIGRVWADHGNPKPALSVFPEGTVAGKLLFTTASEAEVPWLKGSPAWDAYVGVDPHDQSGDPPLTTPRAVRKVRLLQIDVAVKDRRSPVGWFFGTFVYGGGPGGKPGAGWRNVQPVGLMWGNDPGYSGSGPLKESWINPDVKMRHLGYQGRLDGPVDNPKSSCISCHMTAQSPVDFNTLVGNLLPPKGADPAPWFQNIPSSQPFTPGKQSNDYSMNLAFGFVSFYETHQARKASNPAQRMHSLEAVRQGHKNVNPRGGEE